jgi:hypothetical protein
VQLSQDMLSLPSWTNDEFEFVGRLAADLGELTMCLSKNAQVD